MIFDFLHFHQINYQRVDHPPVYTCEEARELVPPINGAETKNLFLRDDKGRRHFLVCVSADKNVNLKQLSEQLEVKGLSFASPDRLRKYLGIEPGSVTLLAVINDKDGHVEVVIDVELWKQDALLCHPLVNTSTLSIPKDDLEKFLNVSSHNPKFVSLSFD